MGVEREPCVGVIVRNRRAVEVNVAVSVRTLGEMMVVQWPECGQNQGNQCGSQGQHPSQRGLFVVPECW